MATFPALVPNSRSYTPGAHASTPLMVLSGNETSVRHSNGSVGNILRLGFRAITRSDLNSLIGHYALHGRFLPFDLSADTLIVSEIEIPVGYQWIYTRSPDIEEVPDAANVTVELELIPPYML
jgi:hypothetical protein